MSNVLTPPAGPNQLIATTTAINYLKAWCLNLILNTPSAVPNAAWPSTPYQGVVAPVTDLSLNVPAPLVAQVQLAAETFVDNITRFINASPNPSALQTNYNAASTVIANNKSALQSAIITWININYPTLVYNQTKCERDIGFIVDAIVNDVKRGSISYSLKAGRAYWNGMVSKLPPGQVAPTVAAFNELETQIRALPSLAAFISIIDDNLSLCFDVINEIVSNGPALDAHNSASQLIRLNKQFLQAEITAYVSDPVFVTNYLSGVPLSPTLLALCTRDVAYLVDAIAADIVGSGIFSIGVTIDKETTVSFEEGTDYEPLDRDVVNFYQVSVASASSHTFEYVGSGTDINTCLPQLGGVPVQEQEVVMRRGGRVYYTSTDHKGDFRIGEGLVINQNTGTLSGRVFAKSLFGLITPFVLSIEQGS
jgi:hypothetical protein